jgi:hypothetical protein
MLKRKMTKKPKNQRRQQLLQMIAGKLQFNIKITPKRLRPPEVTTARKVEIEFLILFDIISPAQKKWMYICMDSYYGKC